MATDDFLRARLDQMIDLRHPLAILAGRMPWSQIETVLAPCFARKNRQGQVGVPFSPEKHLTRLLHLELETAGDLCEVSCWRAFTGA